MDARDDGHYQETHTHRSASKKPYARGHVTITPIMNVKPNRLEGALRDLVPFSGFDSVREWLEEIYKSYGNLPDGWIYRVETRTRARAKREDEFQKTSLRLREILSWRSVELMQAETVANNLTTEKRSVSNYLYAVRQPFVSLYNLVFTDNPVCLYLSFPITNTRDHPERIEDINTFRNTMFGIAEDMGVCIFDPVSIDELALNNAETEGGNRILNAEQRWPLDVELLVNEPDWPISIPENEVLEAERDISNNIKPRDFKLIDNSIFTTVYRKNYGGRSEGVNAEIQYTISRMKKPYVYDPKDDSDPRIPHPFNPEELIYNDKDVFYDEIKKGIEYYKERQNR